MAHHHIRRVTAGALAAGIAMALHAVPLRADDLPKAAAYCADLLRVTDIAATTHKFAVIAGKAREGNFLDTSLPLAGWKDCALYGIRTYTCDSPGFATATGAQSALAGLVNDVTACLGEGWAADKSRSSRDYVVVQNAESTLSMTLSTDAPNPTEHVVHLVLFVRGRPRDDR